MSFKPLFIAAFGLAFALYMTMLVWTLPGIAAAAGGLAPFDMRITGYSVAEAQEFLGNLTPAGRELYLGPQHWLDLFYPGLLALTLILAFSRVQGGWGARIGIMLAITGMVFDYLENWAVVGLLRAEAMPSAELIERASLFTQIKAGATTLAMLLMIAMFVQMILRKRRAI